MPDNPTLLELLGQYNNFGEPEPSWNRTPVIVGLTATFTAISTSCILFRLYTRLYIVKSPGWDDVFVFAYMLTGLMGNICISLSPRFGFGQHFVQLNLENMGKFLRVYYVSNASYNMSTALIKLSLLFQFLRVYEHGVMRMYCKVLLWFVVLWGTAYSFLAWVPCSPPNQFWSDAADETCWGYGSLIPSQFFATYASHGGINMTLDLLILVPPIQMYFSAEKSKRTNMGLLALLVMGGVVNLMSIWRFQALIQHRAATWPTFDPTWYGPHVIILAMLEVALASICASIPVFWPVITSPMEQIFVTKEIQITRTHRYSTDVEDQVELQQAASQPSRCESRSMYSGESEASRSYLAGSAERKNYQHDGFIKINVDPLRRAYAVESEVRGGVGNRP
jgi:hypothetical protein